LLYGGLGNQLFKLFAASKLIEDGFATPVDIDVSWYEHKKPELAPNAEYQLGNVVNGRQFTQTTIKSKTIFNLTNQIRAKRKSFQCRFESDRGGPNGCSP
jgi:hypothetical protein